MLLGELLVYRYQLISKDQRLQAMARQAEAPHKRPLGEILLEMELITEAQLKEVLDYQRAERNPWASAA
jgi:hypothetical protein